MNNEFRQSWMYAVGFEKREVVKINEAVTLAAGWRILSII